MAYKSNYVEKILFKSRLNDRGDHLVLKSLSNPEKNQVEQYDLRKYYINPGGELSPTKQGVRFGYEVTCELLTAFIRFADEDVFQNLSGIFRDRDNGELNKTQPVDVKLDMESELTNDLDWEDLDI